MGGIRDFVLGVLLGIVIVMVFLNTGALGGITGATVIEEQEQPQLVREIIREVVQEKQDVLSCDVRITLVKTQIDQLEAELRNIKGKLVTSQLGSRVSQFDQGDAKLDSIETKAYREQANRLQDRIDELNTELTDLILNCKGTVA